jgi:hypothetical protein
VTTLGRFLLCSLARTSQLPERWLEGRCWLLSGRTEYDFGTEWKPSGHCVLSESSYRGFVLISVMAEKECSALFTAS